MEAASVAVVVRVKPEMVEVGAHGRSEQELAEVNPQFRLQL